MAHAWGGAAGGDGSPRGATSLLAACRLLQRDMNRKTDPWVPNGSPFWGGKGPNGQRPVWGSAYFEIHPNPYFDLPKAFRSRRDRLGTRRFGRCF